MALYSTRDSSTKYTSYSRGPPKEMKCMNCGKALSEGDNMYSRRFCSEECRMNYFL